MLTYQSTSTVIGISLALIILFLVRRDRLHGPYAIWWIGAAATVGGLGFYPELFDHLAVYLGVRYPPILAIILGLGMLLVKILTMDLERSRQERLIRRLTQRLAMLEARGPLPTLDGAELPFAPEAGQSGDGAPFKLSSEAGQKKEEGPPSGSPQKA